MDLVAERTLTGGFAQEFDRRVAVARRMLTAGGFLQGRSALNRGEHDLAETCGDPCGSHHGEE